MELKVIQNNVGRYNLLSNEETLSFSMAIFNGGKIFEKDGVKAIIHFSGEPDEAWEFKNPIEDLNYVFEKCFNYCKGVISSHPYLEQCILFAETYLDNYKEISETAIDKQRKELDYEIKQLISKRDRLNHLADITWEINNCVSMEIDKYSKWKESSENKMNQFKKDTEGYNKEENLIDRYNRKINRYSKLIEKLDKSEIS